MDHISARRIISLSTSFQRWNFDNKKKKLSQSNSLLSRFSDVYERERSKIPYRLNLLDDLVTNENAHSKFLIRLLQHRPTLINFLTFLNSMDGTLFHFNTDNIKKPVLTAEKMRIDGLIRENGKYAIIIENKIHGAVEQENQIARYIEKCNSIGFKTEQIYILYLTRNEWDNPSRQTWGDNYKQEDFHKRYAKLSYKTEILPWLQEYMCALSSEEELIKSAVLQYIDHLKSLYNYKTTHSAMNQELRLFLSREMNLGSNHTENIELLDEKIMEINELGKQLIDLLNLSKEELFQEWSTNLAAHFTLNESQIFAKNDGSFLKTGVILKYKEIPFSVLIEYDLKSRSIYYGFGKHYASENLEPEITAFLSSMVKQEGLKPDIWWYGWKHTSFNDGYIGLQDLVKQTLEILQLANVFE